MLNRHRYISRSSDEKIAVVQVADLYKAFPLCAHLHLSAPFSRLTIRSKDRADRPRRLPAGLISNHYLDTGRAINYCLLESSSHPTSANFFPLFSRFLGERVTSPRRHASRINRLSRSFVRRRGLR